MSPLNKKQSAVFSVLSFFLTQMSLPAMAGVTATPLTATTQTAKAVTPAQNTQLVSASQTVAASITTSTGFLGASGTTISAATTTSNVKPATTTPTSTPITPTTTTPSTPSTPTIPSTPTTPSIPTTPTTPSTPSAPTTPSTPTTTTMTTNTGTITTTNNTAYRLPPTAVRTASNPNYYYDVINNGQQFAIYNQSGTLVARIDRNKNIPYGTVTATGAPDVSPDGTKIAIGQIRQTTQARTTIRSFSALVYSMSGSLIQSTQLQMAVNSYLPAVSRSVRFYSNTYLYVHYSNGTFTYVNIRG